MQTIYLGSWKTQNELNNWGRNSEQAGSDRAIDQWRFTCCVCFFFQFLIIIFQFLIIYKWVLGSKILEIRNSFSTRWTSSVSHLLYSTFIMPISFNFAMGIKYFFLLCVIFIFKFSFFFFSYWLYGYFWETNKIDKKFPNKKMPEIISMLKIS